SNVQVRPIIEGLFFGQAQKSKYETRISKHETMTKIQILNPQNNKFGTFENLMIRICLGFSA
ncbi:MAG: hypothetical protein ACYS6W_14010, partial [Planctomycetota bacterium]